MLLPCNENTLVRRPASREDSARKTPTVYAAGQRASRRNSRIELNNSPPRAEASGVEANPREHPFFQWSTVPGRRRHSHQEGLSIKTAPHCYGLTVTLPRRVGSLVLKNSDS